MKRKRSTPRRREAPRWDRAGWEEANMQLWVRAGGRCECCTRDLNRTGAERHHRRRRRDGGDRLANLLLLAPECHAYWTAHPAEAREVGVIVSTGGPDPELVPVLWRGRDWCLLDDSGTRVPA